MPDTSVEPTPGDRYDPSLASRVSRLEADVNDIKAANSRLEVMVGDLRDTVGDLREMVARIEATLPHLATKADVAELRAELAEKPSRAYLWGVVAALITAYAAGLAALAIVR